MQYPISEELRGLWVCSVLNLDYPNERTTDSESLKADAIALLDKAKDMGINAIFLQVRPCGDALYPSAYYPWSKYLTGEQGLAPDNDFDPLQFFITEAHRRNMQLHAWINPFRITHTTDKNKGDPSLLHSTNLARTNPDWIVQANDGALYLNPGIPEARQYVIDAAAEIAKSYDVDGIHIDDYFYPERNFPDEATYAAANTALSISEWRVANINDFVSKMHKTLHKVKKNIQFGVSPMGIWANKKNNPKGSNTTGGAESLYVNYADTRAWIRGGYVDYVVPQIYWSIGFESADYETLLKWWAKEVRGTRVTLYTGIAGYKVGSGEKGWDSPDQVQKQIALNRRTDEVSGAIHFRARLYFDNADLFETVKKIH